VPLPLTKPASPYSSSQFVSVFPAFQVILADVGVIFEAAKSVGLGQVIEIQDIIASQPT